MTRHVCRRCERRGLRSVACHASLNEGARLCRRCHDQYRKERGW